MKRHKQPEAQKAWLIQLNKKTKKKNDQKLIFTSIISQNCIIYQKASLMKWPAYMLYFNAVSLAKQHTDKLSYLHLSHSKVVSFAKQQTQKLTCLHLSEKKSQKAHSQTHLFFILSYSEVVSFANQHTDN